MAGIVAGRPVGCLALSSRSLIERDDRAKRINFMRDGIWVSEVTFEQLVAACHLPGNDRDTMKVLCLERYVTTGAVGSEPKIPCRARIKISPGPTLTVSVLYQSVYRRVWCHCDCVVSGDCLCSMHITN